MPQTLVIVESPTKARTIKRFLPPNTEVMACMGHVRDLPRRTFGVDIADNFRPEYVLTPSGKKTVSQLKASARKAERIFLATDPDREGEAIAWHLEETLKPTTKAGFYRVTFHEITRDAVRKAFDAPSSLDGKKVEAQQARRILDRLVGYKLSPLLWRHIQKGTSAGRVQSVALRMVCERERTIQAFEPAEYWNMAGHFLAQGAANAFKASLVKVDGDKPNIPDGDTANAFAAELQKADFEISLQRKRGKKQRPSPPFITSTLQQSAGSIARFSARQTMQIAQQLYEGMDIGGGESEGLITYMRTDSVAVSKEAQDTTTAYIQHAFGPDYVPSKPNRFKSGRGAQEAHEAIRPTDVRHTPEQLKQYLSSTQLKLYSLIWIRFVASQMAPAQLAEHTVEVATRKTGLNHDYLFRATDTKVIFPGFKKVYDNARRSSTKDRDKTNPLPEVDNGTACDLTELEKEQKFTEPPKRFTEATLVRELEQKGVGRPSTYASIVHTVQQRSYIDKERGALIPTELGFNVNDYLLRTAPRLFQIDFTAQMESELDNIEEGKQNYRSMLTDFYAKFQAWVQDVELIAAPDMATIQEFVDLFPADINWQEPVKRGRQTYDDQRFFKSLRDQVKEKQKKLSDKQWQALLHLAARYADQIPGLWEAAEKLGVTKGLKLLVQKEKEGPGTESSAPKPSEETLAYLARLENITDWAAPVKRGKRTFDDKAFYESLAEQVRGGKALTLAQKQALRRLFVNYREQIGDFQTLADKYKLTIPEKKEAADTETAARLVELLGQIENWNPPQKRGRRTYDDGQFASSLCKQFKDKGSLTTRQADAARKLLVRYRDQIANFDTVAADLDLPTESRQKPAPENKKESGGTCPECGGELILRRSKRGPFYGCSKFPKCRFTKQVKAESAEAT